MAQIEAQTNSLTKEQIRACRHPVGRLIYYFSAIFLMGVFGLVVVVFSPSTGWYQEVTQAIVDVELGLDVDATKSPDVPQQIGKEFRSQHFGVWYFDEKNAPWAGFSVSAQGIALIGDDVGHGALGVSYSHEHLLLERLAGDRLETLAMPLSFNGERFVLRWQGVDFAATRNVEQSVPMALHNVFGEDSPISEFLQNGIEGWVSALAVLTLVVLVVMLQASHYASTQNAGIKLSPTQFPKAYALYADMAKQMGFVTTPEIYLVNGQGTYNAFASCVSGYRRFTCINAEIFHAFEIGGDDDAFKMIMGHELGHLKLGHTGLFNTALRMLLGLVPLLGVLLVSAYGRAFEYEADRMSLHFVKGSAAAKKYLMLHSSHLLYPAVDLDSYRSDSKRNASFGMFLQNFGSSHPIAPWRVDALCHCSVGGLFLHHIRPQGEATAPKARQIFNAYREPL